ncbi:MAG TPA: tellurite resistance TerB family protein [Polyangiaceae bacterium]|nr:tellurite resistance TerB family protein [Polyangiaceae bacterium]
MPANDSLIGKVLRQLSRPPSYGGARGVKDSILVASAASYGAHSEDDLTQPTGFDPEVARLFEAIVESAYLVANADGEFDQTEQQAFEHVVLEACGGRVAERQIHALLADLHDQLTEDGLDKRIDMVARSIAREDHGQEVLRVAALLAHVSGGVSDVERSVLERLAKALGLNASATAAALAEVATALAD